jgi:hypothetical protein
MNPFQMLFMALGFKHRNSPLQLLKILFFTGIILFCGIYLILTIIADIGHIIGSDKNNATQTPSVQTSSIDTQQQPNQNYTSQSVIADTSQMVIPQPTVQEDTTQVMSVDTTNQTLTSSGGVNNISNNINTTTVDENKKNIIEKYLKGQDNRNFEEFSQYYAPSIRRNWQMNNPTLSQIQGAIYHLWAVTSSSNQTINSAEMVNDSTVKIDVTNVYITRKKSLTKKIQYDIYFVFDNDNQIVETYGFER